MRLAIHRQAALTGGVIALTLLAGGCPSPTGGTLSAPPPPKVDATLGVGDVFDVRVFGEPDLSSTYRIGHDGSIDFPLVGRVAASGKTASDLAGELRTRLVAFLHQPQVSILVKEANSKRVTVYGQVQKPGTYPYAELMTISQAISQAGGFTAMAAREKVLVSRFSRELGKQRVTVVNLLAIVDGKAPNQFVEPGDEVYVPERLF
jgi:polysaccharide export outer membrane protein